MDKLVAFFKNVWTRRAAAIISLAYTFMLVWLAWMNIAYFFEYENSTTLFVIYLFINLAALGLMIYSRKQVITQINSYLLPPIVFVTVIFGFGNWYMIIPPLVVLLVMFFVNASNETLKTVMGTMYLLLYVIGVAGYTAIRMYMGTTSLITDVDLAKRDTSYEELSELGDYRLVRYLETSGDRKTISYFVEKTEDDVDIPFGVCKKVLGCKHIYTTEYKGTLENNVSWGFRTVNGEKTEILKVEGYTRENPYLIKEIEDETGETGATGETSSAEETGTATAEVTATAE